jgi:hypothetical protein
MLALANQMMEKYHTLSLKMGLDASTYAKDVSNLEHLVDVEVLLGLSCVFPLLKALHNHIKFSQMLDVFLCVSLLESKCAKGMSKLCIITQP